MVVGDDFWWLNIEMRGNDIMYGEEKSAVLPFRVKPDINVRTPYKSCILAITHAWVVSIFLWITTKEH